MINSGPGFPGVVWFGSSSTASPSPVSKLDRCPVAYKKTEKERQLPWGERGEWGMRGAKSYDRQAWSSTNHSILSDHAWSVWLWLWYRQQCVSDESSKACVNVWLSHSLLCESYGDGVMTCWDSKSICAYQLKIWVHDWVQDEWLYAEAWLFDRCGFHGVPRWLWACDWVQTGFIVKELGSVSWVIG